MIALCLYLIAFFILAVRYSVDSDNPYTDSFTFQMQYLLLCCGLDVIVLGAEIASRANITIVLALLTVIVSADLLVSSYSMFYRVRAVVKNKF